LADILSFDIEIDVNLSEGSKKTLEELKEQSTDDRVQAGIEGLERVDVDDGFSPDEIDQVRSVLSDELGGLDKSDIQQFGNLAKNPQGFIGQQLTKLLGSSAPAILGPLSIAIATPVVMAEFIKAMSGMIRTVPPVPSGVASFQKVAFGGGVLTGTPPTFA